MKLNRLIAVVLLAAPLAVACNTVKGAGKDIQKAGEAIENTAEKAKPENHH